MYGEFRPVPPRVYHRNIPDAADEVTIATHSHQKKRKREETVGRKFAIILFILKLINVFSLIFQLSVHLLRVLNTYSGVIVKLGSR